MSEQQQSTGDAHPACRRVGGTEHSWCKAVPGGTGITVLALHISKPLEISFLQNALHKLHISHPILRSKLHYNAATDTFSYTTPPTPHLQVQPFDEISTARITKNPADPENHSLSPIHLILEHEMNRNSWTSPHDSSTVIDAFFASVYSLSSEERAVVLRVHTSVCDRAAAIAVLRELLDLFAKDDGGSEIGGRVDVNVAIEDCIPTGKGKKAFWARGVDMLGYSLNSFRLSNLDFVGAASPLYSKVVRLRMNADDTNRVVSGCKSRGIGLCGAMAAAGLLAAQSSKGLSDHQWEKYAVVTLVNCRPILKPVLGSHNAGFYHSAILNTHNIRGGEKLWDLANRCYTSFADAKKNNKHFSDMADLNFLMCKAIDNPGLTPSGALRTALISVFEDPVIDQSTETLKEIGVHDYIGCASVHGVGPSIAIFDTIRDGKLDCACVYPSPLHSRAQIQDLVDNMKRILVDASSNGNE